MSREPRPARKASPATHPRGAQARRLRIIAGRWRGRRWQFPAGGIRPTSDRVRETLFNWLQGRIVGRRCLDLYAGSGALGLEALSRGAGHCVFVDRDVQALAALGALLRDWGAASGEAQLEQSEAQQYLARAAQPFDLVFLDPPFAGEELARSMERLEAQGWLASAGLVYIEHPRAVPVPPPPAAWQALRHGSAGAVGYDLYERR
ncbi:MAG TPA: 16S rRNA (guanine(966)-N(2))-methyltransferase RsmD [Steroidobacteraceae bacterium]